MKVALCALAAFALATNAPAAEPEVRAVRATTLDFRVALRVLTSPDAPPGEVLREGGEIVIRVPGVAPEALALPALEKPLGAIRLVREPGLTILRVEAAPEVPFEASHEPGMLTVVFGEQPAPELRGPVTPDLYERLFPTGAQGTGAPEGEEPAFDRAGGDGIALGRVTLRPYVSVSWVDADVLAFDNPVPVRDQYLQVAPGVTASVPLFDGVLAAEYEPRFRFFSDIPLVNETSHFAGVRYEVPIGSRVFLRLGQRYTRAILETTVVDPGREYFYNLSQYTFWATTAAARVELGPRLFGEAAADWAWTRFDQAQPGGFFDYDTRTLRAGLGYDVGSDLRATVSYAYERIPPSPDRAIVETTAHDLIGTLAGTVAPLTTGSLSVGFRRQTNPLATGGARPSRASPSAGRSGGSSATPPRSSCSSPAPWTRAPTTRTPTTRTTPLVASLSVPVPFEFWARGSVGFLRNDYPNDAPGLGVPRRDDILGWTVGLGRQLGWRTWVRADYRRERRDSNLPGYDVTTDGFVVQLGVGLFGPGSSRP